MFALMLSPAKKNTQLPTIHTEIKQHTKSIYNNLRPQYDTLQKHKGHEGLVDCSRYLIATTSH